MLLKPKVSSKLKKSQVKTSNVEFLKLVVAESEDINTRWRKSINEESARSSDERFVFFKLAETAKVEVFVCVVKVNQIVHWIVVVVNSEKIEA